MTCSLLITRCRQTLHDLLDPAVSGAAFCRRMPEQPCLQRRHGEGRWAHRETFVREEALDEYARNGHAEVAHCQDGAYGKAVLYAYRDPAELFCGGQRAVHEVGKARAVEDVEV